MTQPSTPEAIARAGLICIDKPAGLTSHDVVARVRRGWGTKKVGHAGTLDPMATGVLVIGVHRATKMMGLITLADKTYTATIRLGQSTHTDDKEGDVLASGDARHLTEQHIREACEVFVGDIMQRPASVSAIKINGKRAHQLVREGQHVDIPARPVTVHSLSIEEIRPVNSWVDVDVQVHCSSGTYIRSIARDLGQILHVGGHLTALRRTTSGPFDVSQSMTLDDFMDNPRLSLNLDEAATTCFPTRQVTAEQAETLAHGRWLDPIGQPGIYACIDPQGVAIALVKESGNRAAATMVVRPSTL